MARATDQILAKYVAEIEERQQFIDSLVESSNGEDLTDEKMELLTRAKDRIAECNRQMAPRRSPPSAVIRRSGSLSSRYMSDTVRQQDVGTAPPAVRV
jgi:hypothetical protein